MRHGPAFRPDRRIRAYPPGRSRRKSRVWHPAHTARSRANSAREGAMPKALITGITGQDGSYLAELLLEKGYEVHGLVRRSSSFNTWRIDHLPRESVQLHYADLNDQSSMRDALKKSK